MSTKEERKAKREAEQARLHQENEARVAKFLAGLPKRLMEAQALATEVGVRNSVRLTEAGPAVGFYLDDDGDYFDAELTYQSEEWEVESLECSLRGRKEKLDAAKARKELAQNIFSKLSENEKIALKEFIHYLR